LSFSWESVITRLRGAHATCENPGGRRSSLRVRALHRRGQDGAALSRRLFDFQLVDHDHEIARCSVCQKTKCTLSRRLSSRQTTAPFVRKKCALCWFTELQCLSRRMPGNDISNARFRGSG